MSYPILAEKQTWYTQGGTTIDRKTITEINIVDSYTPTGTETESWDGSASKNGSIIVYRTGTVLTIAGNGSGKISFSINAREAFSYFEKVVNINGLELLDTSNSTDITLIFGKCKALVSANVKDWDVSKVVYATQAFWDCNSLTSIDVSRWNTQNFKKLIQIFSGCSLITSLDISNWNLSNQEILTGMFSHCTKLSDLKLPNIPNITSLSECFQNCKSLTNLDIPMWDTSKVTDMYGLFLGCSSIKSFDFIKNWDVSRVTNMKRMFFGCKSIDSLDLSAWDVSNVTNMESLFSSCSAITSINISNWNTGNVTNMDGMFNQYTSPVMPDISNWDVSKVTNMGTMFYKCTSPQLLNMDFTKWDVSSVTDMNLMFMGCSLTSLDLSNWNTASLTDVSGMFWDCTSLTGINLNNFNMSNVTDMGYMFYSCSSLTYVNAGNWNTSNVTDMSYMFTGCTSLTTLDVSNWNVSKVETFEGMFSSGQNYANTMKVKLDTSKWDTSSATSFAFMFYGCGSAQPDVSNWNVSKVETFDHMFAHSHTESVIDTSKWDTSSAISMYGMFHTVKSKVLNVSNFNTSKVITLGQMFEYCGRLTKIIGLENFDTSSCIDFSEMFHDCSNLKELDLSSFDTTKAKDGDKVSPNGGLSRTLFDMFSGVNRLEKITLGENFSFNGDGTTTNNVAIIPSPNSEYIRRANGSWYNESNEIISEIPDRTSGTYCAVPRKYREFVLITRGSLEDIAEGIRINTGNAAKLYPEDMGNIVATMSSGSSIITSIENNSLILETKQDARLGELSTLVLAMPESSVNEYFESFFSFTSGSSATSLSYSSTPIIWRGDDCDANGDFVPEPDTKYEVGIKCVGTDENGELIIVARVGGY